jgi:hypothetical protein
MYHIYRYDTLMINFSLCFLHELLMSFLILIKDTKHNKNNYNFKLS